MTLRQASARIDAAIRSAASGAQTGVWGSRWVEPLRSALPPVKHTTILLLYGSACLLLVLVCANLASLYVARSIAEIHETGVRMALGATRWRLLCGDFQEAVLLSAAGTGVAFLVESWLRPLVPKALPAVKTVGPELLAAGPVRLRPILMTTGAMIFGMMPVAVGLSEGGEMRAPMAIAVIGGLITSTLLTLVVVPVAYDIIDAIAERMLGHATVMNEGEETPLEAKSKGHIVAAT